MLHKGVSSFYSHSAAFRLQPCPGLPCFAFSAHSVPWRCVYMVAGIPREARGVNLLAYRALDMVGGTLDPSK